MLDNLIRNSQYKGLAADDLLSSKYVLEKYSDVFLVCLGSKPLVQIKPMTITLQNEAQPVQLKPRRYFSQQLWFLEKIFKEIIDFGII